MEYLIALDEAQSFLRAAEICSVTQPTLSAGIKEMEHVLDAHLVNRGRKNITLTAFGAEVAMQARQILRDTDQITMRAQQLKAPLTGPLRLGVIPTIAPYFLPQILPTLERAFPALELQIHEDLSDRIVEKLNHGALDVLLMAFPFETPGLSQMFLFEEAFYLAMPADQDFARNSVKIGDLNADDLLLLEDGHCLRDHALGACGLQDAKQRKAYSATSLATLIQMVSHRYGATLLPEMAAQKPALPAAIKVLPFEDPKPTRQIGLAWRSGHPRRCEFEMLGQAMML